MNYRKRKKQWQKEIDEGTKSFEERTGIEYDYYGNVSRRKSMNAPKEKNRIRLSKIIRFVLFIIYIVYQFL